MHHLFKSFESFFLKVPRDTHQLLMVSCVLICGLPFEGMNVSFLGGLLPEEKLTRGLPPGSLDFYVFIDDVFVD